MGRFNVLYAFIKILTFIVYTYICNTQHTIIIIQQ